MLLNAENLDKIQYKTKRVKLEKADAEINVALIPVSLIEEAKAMKGKTENDEKVIEVSMKILMSAVVDDKGNPVFKTKEAFESLPLAIQTQIQEAVFEYNGLSGDVEKN